MTKNRASKKATRARMATSDEKYSAARRALTGRTPEPVVLGLNHQGGEQVVLQPGDHTITFITSEESGNRLNLLADIYESLAAAGHPVYVLHHDLSLFIRNLASASDATAPTVPATTVLTSNLPELTQALLEVADDTEFTVILDIKPFLEQSRIQEVPDGLAFIMAGVLGKGGTGYITAHASNHDQHFKFHPGFTKATCIRIYEDPNRRGYVRNPDGDITAFETPTGHPGPETEPRELLATVIDRDGNRWVRWANDAPNGEPWARVDHERIDTNDTHRWDTLQANHGPLTVLWD